MRQLTHLSVIAGQCGRSYIFVLHHRTDTCVISSLLIKIQSHQLSMFYNFWIFINGNSKYRSWIQPHTDLTLNHYSDRRNAAVRLSHCHILIYHDM